MAKERPFCMAFQRIGRGRIAVGVIVPRTLIRRGASQSHSPPCAVTPAGGRAIGLCISNFAHGSRRARPSGALSFSLSFSTSAPTSRANDGRDARLQGKVGSRLWWPALRSYLHITQIPPRRAASPKCLLLCDIAFKSRVIPKLFAEIHHVSCRAGILRPSQSAHRSP